MIAMGEILAMDDAVEADSVDVRMDKGKQTGTLKVTGCRVCPLKLHIDSGTRFFHDNQPVRQRQIRFLSRKTGTVIYSNEQQRALKIFW